MGTQIKPIMGQGEKSWIERPIIEYVKRYVFLSKNLTFAFANVANVSVHHGTHTYIHDIFDSAG